MKDASAGYSFIVRVRENNEYMPKLLRILRRHRKICGNEKACHPKERNDEENNQENSYRFLSSFQLSVYKPPPYAEMATPVQQTISSGGRSLLSYS